MNYNDGTKPSQEFKPMKPEDRKWLEEAMAQYTFEPTNKMKECLVVLRKHKELQQAELEETLDELLEYIDMHPTNGVNLCKMNGMGLMFEIIIEN